MRQHLLLWLYRHRIIHAIKWNEERQRYTLHQWKSAAKGRGASHL